jgi:hypothetical protein
MVIVEKLVEWRLAGETEVLGENLSQRHFVHHKNPTWLDLGLNPGRRGGKPATNRLSYGAAFWIYAITPSQIQSASAVMAHAWDTTMGSASSGSWTYTHRKFVSE